MTRQMDREKEIENTWRMFMTTGGNEEEQRRRRILKILPGSERCRVCYAPFNGLSGKLVWTIYHKQPSNLNPNLCNACEEFARTHQGGVEIELSLLFADVRGSTSLAEKMSSADYHKLINRFYNVASKVMVDTDALIDKIIGDQAAGMYVPGFAGNDHANRAIEAAQKILKATGHGTVDGPWIPLGVGVHTGRAFIGAVGSQDGTTDITVLGDVANTAARLSTNAGIGEILISESAFQHARYKLSDGIEKRELLLKGKNEQIIVYVLSS